MASIISTQGKGMPIGTLFYALRVEDDLGSALRCDGRYLSGNDYPVLLQHVSSGRVPFVWMADWDWQYNNQGANVGVFGYDGNNTMRLPVMQSNIFMASGYRGNLGAYNQDCMQNIWGFMGTYNTFAKINGSDGAFYEEYYGQPWGISGGATDDWWNLRMDSSRVTRTGTYTQPRHLTYSVFVVVK
ncbi:hypothetical protein FACS1894152_5180 [Bacilli bacterium]|nr:hypothetical protein FACS1894152_5180 [Bacilli bacterium]